MDKFDLVSKFQTQYLRFGALSFNNFNWLWCWSKFERVGLHLWTILNRSVGGCIGCKVYCVLSLYHSNHDGGWIWWDLGQEHSSLLSQTDTFRLLYCGVCIRYLSSTWARLLLYTVYVVNSHESWVVRVVPWSLILFNTALAVLEAKVPLNWFLHGGFKLSKKQ